MMRGFLRGVIALCGALAGCGWFTGPGWYGMYGVTPAYGVFPPSPPHDPSVEIVEFAYTPVSPIRLGDPLDFIAVTNKPTDAASVVVRVWRDNAFDLFTELRDDGITPDDAASDGRWAGTLAWSQGITPFSNAPMTVELQWLDGYQSSVHPCTPLTVLPEEDQ